MLDQFFKLPEKQFVAVWFIGGNPFSMTFNWVNGVLKAYDFTTDKFEAEHGITSEFLSKVNAQIIETK